MLVEYKCECGNTDVSKAKEYDGAMGYEAIVCLECGRYSDDTGGHPADTWSCSFIPGWRAPVVEATPPANFPEQVIVLDPKFATDNPGEGYYLRVQRGQDVEIVRLRGESTLPGARTQAIGRGFQPTHWIELPSCIPMTL